MKKYIAKVASYIGFNTADRKSSDFSDFFVKAPVDKKKVISEILHEVNREQRMVVDEYRKQLNKV